MLPPSPPHGSTHTIGRTRATPRRQPAPWYATAFGRDYLERYAHRSESAAAHEVAFVARVLAQPPGAVVLDLCCGGGRHSRALARLGYRVIGVDLSRDLLAHTRAHPAGPLYVRADSRALPLRDAGCDAALNLFTSFGYFGSEDEDLAMLREVARVLRRGGRFVLDFLNLEPTLKHLAPRTERRLARVHVTEERRFDPLGRRLEKRIRVEDTQGAEAPREFLESVRAYTPEELEGLLRRAGLQVEQRFGGLDGAPFHRAESPRCVLVARPARRDT